MTQSTRAPRFHVGGFSVVYDSGEGYWTGPVRDASSSGLFIETSHELPLGTRLTIMPSDEDERVPFEVTGVVVRVNELDLDNHFDRIAGIAVRLEGLSPEQAAAFEAFLSERGSTVDR